MTRLAGNHCNNNPGPVQNEHLFFCFSVLIKLPSNCADNIVLQPTFFFGAGRAIIIILPRSRQLSAYLQCACHALFTRLALKCFFPPLPLSIPVESITLLNKQCCLPFLPDRVIIPTANTKTHTDTHTHTHTHTQTHSPPSLPPSADNKLVMVCSQCVHQKGVEGGCN